MHILILLSSSNPLVQAHLLKQQQQTTKVAHPVLEQSPVDMVMSLDPSAAPEVSPEEAGGSGAAEALPNGGSQADNLRQRLEAREAACEGLQEQLAAAEAQLESQQVTAGFAVGARMVARAERSGLRAPQLGCQYHGRDPWWLAACINCMLPVCCRAACDQVQVPACSCMLE